MKEKYLLSLNAHPKIGGQTIKKVLTAFDEDVEKIWKASEEILRTRLGDKISSYVIEARKEYGSDDQVNLLQRLGIGYITMYDKQYPSLLKEVPDSPAVLYIKGNVEVLNMPSIAIVGSRKYSSYGRKVASDLTRECAAVGLSIVSGLALGIDAIVHKATLDVDGITVGVLGCGLDLIYPVSNQVLGMEIVEKGGALISEFPPGTPPYKQNFPARNRIIAGLSIGTLVVEAAERSGALITAYQALDYNREVFAVPGNIDAENSIGTNKLIKEGARVVTESRDIFNVLNINNLNAEKKSRQILPDTPEEKILYDILSEQKMIDRIIAESKLNIITVNTSLTMMEMKGIIENLGGGRYQRK